MSPGIDHASVLSHSQLFRGIPIPALQDLLTHGKLIKTPEQGVLVEEHSVVNGLHVIVDGFVEIVKRGQSQVTQLGIGSFFGEISLFSMAIGASASVNCPQGCTTFVISQAELKAWFKRHPQSELIFFRHLATELCHRLYSTTAKLQ